MVAMLHAATYATLYAMFVGATFQLAISAARPPIGLVVALDFAVSWLFMAAAARRIAAVLRHA